LVQIQVGKGGKKRGRTSVTKRGPLLAAAERKRKEHAKSRFFIRVNLLKTPEAHVPGGRRGWTLNTGRQSDFK